MMNYNNNNPAFNNINFNAYNDHQSGVRMYQAEPNSGMKKKNESTRSCS